MEAKANDDTKCFLEVTLAKQRYVTVHLLNSQEDIKENLNTDISWVPCRTSMKAGHVYTDNDPERTTLEKTLKRLV